MKIIPVLAITNALALALAIFLYVQQGELKSQANPRRSDSAETSRLVSRVESLERELKRALEMKGLEPAAPAAAEDEPFRSGAPAPGAPAAAEGATPFAGLAPETGEDAGAAGTPDFDPREMDLFRHKVRKAIELNGEEDQKNRVIERIDELVKENKIAPLNASQKEGVAKTVLSYRQRVPAVWQKLRESGALENASREERGMIVRTEYETLRSETQQALEQFMPAVDAKVYLDETMRDQMRGGFSTFGGPPPASPAPPGRAR